MYLRVAEDDISKMNEDYKSYVAGTYIKVPFLTLDHFHQLYNELDNDFAGFGKTGKMQFITEANALLKGYFELFSHEKDVCLEISEQVNELMMSVINSEGKDLFVGWWATAQLGKLISQFFLKVKASYEKMIVECEEMRTGDILSEYYNEIEMMYDRLQFKAISDNIEKHQLQDKQFREFFLK